MILGGFCFTNISCCTNKYKYKSGNNILPTKDKYCLLGAYILIGKSTSGNALFLYKCTYIRVPDDICGMVQYNHVAVIIGPFYKIVKKKLRSERCPVPVTLLANTPTL